MNTFIIINDVSNHSPLLSLSRRRALQKVLCGPIRRCDGLRQRRHDGRHDHDDRDLSANPMVAQNPLSEKKKRDREKLRR